MKKIFITLLIFFALIAQSTILFAQIPSVEFRLPNPCNLQTVKYEGSNYNYWIYPIEIRFINYPEGINIGHIYGEINEVRDGELCCVWRSILPFPDEYCNDRFVVAESETNVVSSSEYKQYNMRVPKAAFTHGKGEAIYEFQPYAQTAYGIINTINSTHGTVRYKINWDYKYYGECDEDYTYESIKHHPLMLWAEKCHYYFSENGCWIYFLLHFSLVLIYLITFLTFIPSKISFRYWLLNVLSFAILVFSMMIGDCLSNEIEEPLDIIFYVSFDLVLYVFLFTVALAITAGINGMSPKDYISYHREKRERRKRTRQIKKQEKKKLKNIISKSRAIDRKEMTRNHRPVEQSNDSKESDTGWIIAAVIICIGGLIAFYFDATDGTRRSSQPSYYGNDYYNEGNCDPFDSDYHPSFLGTYNDKYKGKKCSHNKSDGHYCSCPGFVSKHKDPATCANCGHPASEHTR